ncbi:hypothetical protein F5884DRAFT_788773 [Xylogone sp. PMI_703]|nr:hypothetical protein F5884DRAFT_788773 [Xylogone sp. PMI_703]
MLENTSHGKEGFSPLPQSEEDTESQISSSQSDKHHSHPRRKLAWIIASLQLIALSIISTLFGVWLGRTLYTQNPDKICIAQASRYRSPILNDVDLSFQSVRFNGSLFKDNIYRKEASPEVDEAWQALGVDYRVAVVPSDQAERAGLTPDYVQINEKYGGGYVANVEGLHHLHCLNLLRQSLYYNYDYYHDLGQGAFKNDDFVVRYHVTHCLDILRQQLMCTVDTGMLGQIWWNKTHPNAYPDFNTEHKCKNFETVRKWAEERQAPENPPLDYIKMPLHASQVYETIP